MPLSPKARQNQIRTLQAEHKALLQEEKKIAFANRPICPYCGQKHVHSMGMRNGIRHYRCTSCKKSYCARTGTSFYWLHLPQKFNQYANRMLSQGFSTLKEMSLAYNISVNTAFDWRHKVLAAINCAPEQYQGFIELRNSTFSFSRKGIKASKSNGIKPEKSNTPVQLLIAADYSNNAGIEVARIGQLKVSDIETHFVGRIAKEQVIISPYTKALQQFNRKQKLGMTLFSKKFNPHELEDKKAKALDTSLRLITNEKAHGVSTKYLHHYARWALLTTPGIMQQETVKSKINLSNNPSAWAGYTFLEQRYASFSKRFSDEDYVKTSRREWKLAIRFQGK